MPAPTNPTPSPLNEETAKQFVTFKGGSYVSMMKKLFENSMLIPSSIPIDSRQVLNALIIDANIAGVRRKLEDNYSTSLNQISQEISEQIEELKQTKATVQFGNNFSQEYNPLKANVLSYVDKHEELLKKIKGLIAQQKEMIPPLFNQFAGKEISLSTLEVSLNTFKNKHQEITNETISLFENKKVLQEKLESLHTQTSQTVSAAKGEQLQGPAAGKSYE